MANIEGILFSCNGVLIDNNSGFAVKNALQTLESLVDIPKAVNSEDYIDEMENKLTTVNLKKHFEVMVGTGKFEKPHPEVYLKSAAALRKSIYSCLAVENSVTGLKAAIASGAISVAYAPTKQEQEELGALRPEFIIKDMLELVELYNQLNGED